MNKIWLRGILPAMSLALLLVAGCADKDCVPCYPRTVRLLAGPDGIPDEYVVNLSARLTDGHGYLANLYQNGEPASDVPVRGVPGATEVNASFFVTCDDPTFFLFTDAPGVGPFSGPIEDPFGEWQLGAGLVEQDAHSEDVDDWVQWIVEWLVADECPQEEEFVPEPGTVALLGTGLVGLAGYATLRWRSRQ